MSDTHAPIPKHDWTSLPARKLAGCDAPDGNDRTLKTCARCGLVKITVHPVHGYPFREWRFPNGDASRNTATPSCVPEAAEVKAV